MTDAEPEPALTWAAEGEDARWRLMPRFAPVVWVVFALAQGAPLVSRVGGVPNEPTWLTVGRGALVVLGLGLALWTGSWTAAHSDGLRVRNGLRTHEVAWGDVASLRRSRMWGFVLHTQDGTSHPLQGLTQARLGHLLRIWASHRGESEPLTATTGRERHGLWAPEPRRFLGARLGLGVVLILVSTATIFVLLVTDAPTAPVAIAAALVLGALLAALHRVFFTGTVLSRDRVKVRTPTRTRQVPWSAVSELSVDGREVVLHTGDDAVVPLVGVSAGDLPAVEQARVEADTDTSG